MSEREEPQQSGISRRTVAKAMAWAVPAVAIATPVPAFAASPLCLDITLGGDACKWPGSGNDWSYNLEFCFTNNCPDPITVLINKITNNANKPFTACTNDTHIGVEYQLAAGETLCVGPFPYSSESSANFIQIYGQIKPDGGVYGPEELLAPGANGQGIPAPVQDCAGDSPCA